MKIFAIINPYEKIKETFVMSDLQLALLILGIAVVAAVYGYNVYQEIQFRKKIRAQFGGSQEDALLNTAKNQVRDPDEQTLLQPAFINNDDANDEPNRHEDLHDYEEEEEAIEAESFEEDILQQEEQEPAQAYIFEEIEVEAPTQTQALAKQKLLLNLDEMAQINLSWFDKRFDYLAFLSLPFPQELSHLPRLSNRRRYHIVGCTQDGRYQEAEAIPGVLYQGFVAGLQAIDRNGLVSTSELQQFAENVNQFAQQLQAGLHLTDSKIFLEQARPLDQLCEEVDKVIAIHLISPTSVPGVELRAAIEETGFRLEPDGSFRYAEEEQSLLFSLVSLDNTPFTNPLLNKQAYRGFSLLFDVALVPDGEKSFNYFMSLAVKLSNKLHLDLVDDQRRELSTARLKDIRNFVAEQQKKLQNYDIEPGGKLSIRLFS